MHPGGWWHAHVGLTIVINKSLWREIFRFPVIVIYFKKDFAYCSMKIIKITLTGIQKKSKGFM